MFARGALRCCAAAAGGLLAAAAPPRAHGAETVVSGRTFSPCAEPACGSRGGDSAALDGFVGARRSGRALPACPPDREELGRATWMLLHSVAAYYPEQPTAGEMAAARDLVAAIATLYPCAHCRERLAVDLASLPVQPALQSRTALCAWVCAQHNLVNEALGKPLVACNQSALDERWRTGRAGCWDAARGAATAEESLGRASAAEEEAERADARP